MFRTVQGSEHLWARVAGISLLAVIVFGFAGIGLRSISGNAPALIDIIPHELRYRAGLLCEFAMLNSDIVLAVALYRLLKRVSAPVALLGALWRFANAIMLALGIVAALTALELARGIHGSAIAGLNDASSAPLLFKLHSTASMVGLFFWSMGSTLHSYVLWRSRYIPRVLSGAYLAVAAFIFAGCFTILLVPTMRHRIDPWFVLPDLPVELAVALWLAIKGARVETAGP